MMTILPHYGTRTMDLDRVYCLLPALQKNNTPPAGLFPLLWFFSNNKSVLWFFPTTKVAVFLCLAKPHAVLALANSNGFCHFDFVPLSNLGLAQSLWQQIPQYSKST